MSECVLSLPLFARRLFDGRSTLWSALTCQRFGLRLLDAVVLWSLMRMVAATGRDRPKR
jgi:hypothetical protein